MHGAPAAASATGPTGCHGYDMAAKDPLTPDMGTAVGPARAAVGPRVTRMDGTAAARAATRDGVDARPVMRPATAAVRFGLVGLPAQDATSAIGEGLWAERSSDAALAGGAAGPRMTRGRA